MPQLTLSLLGSFDVRLDSAPVTGFRSDKVRALLAYLVVEADRSHTRAKLAGLLWPDYGDSAALTYLRHALSNLRKILANGVEKPPFLRVENDVIQFLDHETCWSDFTYLIHALHTTATPTDRHWQERLQQGLTAYRGPLLDGFALVDSDRFEEWLLFRRERLQREVIEAWTQLAHSYLAQQAVALAISALQRIVELEPTAEETHRHLMQLLASTGKRSEALAQFERCRQLLADELGVNPAAETLALYQQLSQPTLTLNRMPTPSPPRFAPLPAFFATPQIQAGKTPVLVARQGELARLDQLLAQAYQGAGTVVFVTGEAGQGKTALATEFALRAQTHLLDLLVAGGNCNAQAGMGDPYLPFCEILELLTGAVESRLLAGALTREHALRLWRAAPVALHALCEVAPDLIDALLTAAPLLQRADALAGQAPALPGQLAAIRQHIGATSGAPQPRQEQLLRQVTTLLQRVAQQHPLLLLIDDLQWADNGSIQLLFHLARQLAGQRILVIGLLRSSEVHWGRNGERHPLEPVINELKRTFGEIEIDLSQSAGRAFVDALLDREPNRLDETFRAMLYHQTEGHPLFTVELLRGMQERGDLRRDSDGQWIAGEGLEWDRLPARVEAVIAERIARLSPTLQRLLQVASVEGEFFTAEVAARVLDSSEAETMRQLSELADRRHQLVRARGIQRLGEQRLSSYRFAHILFQRYLYHRLNSIEQALLHEATGNALEAINAGQSQRMAEVANQLAFHFEAAGIIEKAVFYFQRAGERAYSVVANEDAIAHYYRALGLLQTLPETQERQQKELDLRLLIGPAFMVSAGFNVAAVRDNYEQAYQLCKVLGNEQQLPLVLWGLRNMHSTGAQLRKALALGAEYLALAEKTQDPEMLMIGYRNQGQIMFQLAEYAQSLTYSKKAVELYDPRWHKALVRKYGRDPGSSSYHFLSLCLWVMGYPDQAIRWNQEALQVAENNGYLFELTSAYFMVAYLGQYRGEAQKVELSARAALALAQKHKFTFFVPPDIFLVGWAMAQQGQLAEGIGLMEQGLAVAKATQTIWARRYCLCLLADGYRMAHRPEPGLAAIDEALEGEAKCDDVHWEPELYRLRGELLLLLAPVPIHEVEDCFQQSLTLTQQHQAKSLELRAATSLARLWQGQGKFEDAYQLLAPVYGWFTEGFDTHDLQAAKALLDELRHLCATPAG